MLQIMLETANDDPLENNNETDNVSEKKIIIEKFLGMVMTDLKLTTNYSRASEYLKLLDQRGLDQVHPEFSYCLSILSCYCYIMSMPHNNEEEDIIVKRIKSLVEKYPPRYMSLLLEVIFTYKKEHWSKSIYLSEQLLNFQIISSEEIKYRSCPYFEQCFSQIPEFDIGYCRGLLIRIQGASMSGQIEKLASLKNVDNCENIAKGLSWTSLWTSKSNDRLMKRIHCHKKPMTDLDLHKIFHKDILPVFHDSVYVLQFYFKQEYLSSCNDCIRASMHEKAMNEFVKTIKMNIRKGEQQVLIAKHFRTGPSTELRRSMSGLHKMSETITNQAVQEATEKKNVGIQSFVQQKHKPVQTDKISQLNQAVQVVTDTKHVGIQTNMTTKKEEFKLLDSLKNEILKSNKNVEISMTDHLYAIQRNLTDVLSNIVANKLENETLEQIAAEMEDKREVVKTLQAENKELFEKNFKLQKLLIDQLLSRYTLHKDVLCGLESKTKFVIKNLEELQQALGPNSIPNVANNAKYLSCWQKTLKGINSEVATINAIYDGIKCDMIDLNNFRGIDWPRMIEIPNEAYMYVFNHLKEGIRYQNHISAVQSGYTFSTPTRFPHQVNVYQNVNPVVNRMPYPLFLSGHKQQMCYQPAFFPQHQPWNNFNLFGPTIYYSNTAQTKVKDDLTNISPQHFNTTDPKEPDGCQNDLSLNENDYDKEKNIFEYLQNEFPNVLEGRILNGILKVLEKYQDSFDTMSLEEIRDKIEVYFSDSVKNGDDTEI